MNEVQRITSTGNELIKACARLKERKEREQKHLFLAEGEKLCMEALRSGYQPYAIFALEKKEELLTKFGTAPKYTVAEKVIEKLSDSESPQGIIGAFEMKNGENTAERPNHCIILENIQDPGNFGTIVRTAECFGIDCVITVGLAVDIFNQKVLRGSMGSALRMRILHFATPMEMQQFLLKNNIPLCAAVLDKDAVQLTDFTKDQLKAVAIGNEGSGLSRELISLANKKVYIPMTGAAESLNAAAAAGIIMWSMYR